MKERPNRMKECSMFFFAGIFFVWLSMGCYGPTMPCSQLLHHFLAPWLVAQRDASSAAKHRLSSV